MSLSAVPFQCDGWRSLVGHQESFVVGSFRADRRSPPPSLSNPSSRRSSSPWECRPACRHEPERILPLLALSAAAARDQGAHGLWLTLQTRRVAALRSAGRVAEAREQALAVWQRVEDGVAGLEMFPRLAADLCTALADTHAGLMQVIALRASAWMQRAAATLPAEWRQNYLMRSPIRQALPPAGA